MDLIYTVMVVGCTFCCGFWILRWCIRQLIAAYRTRSNAIDEEQDILLTHEADPELSEDLEAYAENFQAWSEELTAKARKLAEKLDGCA